MTEEKEMSTKEEMTKAMETLDGTYKFVIALENVETGKIEICEPRYGTEKEAKDSVLKVIKNLKEIKPDCFTQVMCNGKLTFVDTGSDQYPYNKFFIHIVKR